MRKQFIIPIIIPRYDTNNSIPTRNELSEGDDGYNAFSNHPTDKKKWSRDILVGNVNPLLRNGGRQNRI